MSTDPLPDPDDDEIEPIPLDGTDPSPSYEDYLASLPPELRDSIQRATSQWDREEREERERNGQGGPAADSPV